jgi:uncharacterized protein (TIGR03118 family)
MHDDTVCLDDLTRGIHPTRTPSFIQTDLISDGSVSALTTDPNLINPWGIAQTWDGRFFIADNGTGVTTNASVHGQDHVTVSMSNITIPGPASGTTSSPTGAITNDFHHAFTLSDGKSASLLFATEDGTIAGWNKDLGQTAQLVVNNNTNTADGDPALGGAVYKGLAIGDSSNGPTLYAANFRHGTVDMFDRNFNQIGSFTDSTIPSGYAPFNVQVLGDTLYVTFAQQNDTKHDDVAGSGHGFVDAFDLNGNLLGRVGSGGTLDSPWGLAIAPSGFGSFAGDLLVGNFGDGTINAFNQRTDQFVGQLTGTDGKAISINDLWSIRNTLYFASGVANEAHGLFGSLTVAHTW